MPNAHTLRRTTNDNARVDETRALESGLGGPISGYFKSNNEVPDARTESPLPPTRGRRHHTGGSRLTTPQYSDPTQRQHVLLWRRSLVLIALDRSGRVEPVRRTPSTRSNNTSPARHGTGSAASDPATVRSSHKIAGPSRPKTYSGSRHGATQPVTAILNGFPVRPEGRRTLISACTHGKKWVASQHPEIGDTLLTVNDLTGYLPSGNPCARSTRRAA